MHLILDEKKYTIYENYFIITPSCGVLNLSIAIIISVKFTINKPLTKLSSTNFTVFGPDKHENLFCKNFCS